MRYPKKFNKMMDAQAQNRWNVERMYLRTIIHTQFLKDREN
jgi:hypothetical protein